MKRLFVVVFLACQSAPKNYCANVVHAAFGAAAPPTNCTGLCVAIGDAGTEQCVVDCTDGGEAVCPTGYTCTSGAPVGLTSSYCLLPCGTDDAGNDAGSCPSPLSCVSNICAP